MIRQPDREPTTLAGIGRAIGLLAHDLSNTITVLMGVAEELRDAGLAGGAAETTEAAAAKLDRLSKALFSLRQDALAGQAADDEACARELSPWIQDLEEVARAYAGMPRIQAARSQVRGLWAILGALARYHGGFEDVAPAEVPATLTPRLAITCVMRLRDTPAVAGLAPLADAVEDAGGTLAADANRITLRLPAVRLGSPAGG